MRRLVYYLDAVGYGGAVNYVERLIEGMEASEFALTIVSPESPAFEAFREALARRAIRWVGVPAQPDLKQAAYQAAAGGSRRRRTVQLPGIRGAAKTALGIVGVLAEARRRRAVRAVLRRTQPDLLHVNLDRFPDVSGKLALLEGRAAGARAVLATLHRPPQVPVSRAAFTIYFDRRALLAADRIIVVAEQLGRELVERYEAPSDRLTVIPNGAPRDLFEERAAKLTLSQLGFEEPGLLVVHVGSVVPWRGQLILARALSELKDECPGLRGAFVGGVFDPTYAAEVDALLASHAGTPFRRFGHRPDATEILRLADVAVLSSFEEGHSFALLEAMALGKAIVATDLESNVSSLAGGEAGLIVTAGDSRAMADAIRRLYLDADLRARMGAAARARAASLYTEERMVRATLDVYRGLPPS